MPSLEWMERQERMSKDQIWHTPDSLVSGVDEIMHSYAEIRWTVSRRPDISGEGRRASGIL